MSHEETLCFSHVNWNSVNDSCLLDAHITKRADRMERRQWRCSVAAKEEPLEKMFISKKRKKFSDQYIENRLRTGCNNQQAFDGNANKCLKTATKQDTQNYITSQCSLFKRLAFALVSALRQETLLHSLLVLVAQTKATTFFNGKNSTSASIPVHVSNDYMLPHSPLLLGHFLRRTLTFCHWIFALAALFSFILCINNLISTAAAVSQQQQDQQQHQHRHQQQQQQQQQQQPQHRASLSNGNGKSESTSLPRELDYNNHYLSPVARVRTSLGVSPHHVKHLSGQDDPAVIGKSFALMMDTNDDEQALEASQDELGRRKNPATSEAASMTKSAKRKQPRSVVAHSSFYLPDLSFRQSSPVAALAMESQWIPIIPSSPSSSPSSNNDYAHPASSLLHNGHGHAGANALLDYPPTLSSLIANGHVTNTVRHLNSVNLALSSDRQLNGGRQQQQQAPAGLPSLHARPNHTQAQLPLLHTAQNGARTEPLHQTASHYELYASGPNYHAPSAHWRHQHRRPRLSNSNNNNNNNNNLYSAAVAENEISTLAPSKMYKRVLLCDKTLVSLDYVRSPDSEPRPFGRSYANLFSAASGAPSSTSDGLLDEVLNDIGDNLIDLDGHYSTLTSTYAEASDADSIANASVASTSRPLDRQPTGSIGRRNRTNQMQTQSGNGNHLSGGNDLLNLTGSSSSGDGGGSSSSSSGSGSSSSSGSNSNSFTLMPSSERLSVAENSLPERKSSIASTGHLFNDNDPLVRCDMWDLDKGLKSRKPPEHLLRVAIKADFDTARNVINRCRQLSEKTLPPEEDYRDGLEIMSTEHLMSLFSMKRGLIPGTKWCGLGDQASSYNDLGPKHNIDICCRAHDHCPIRSKPFRNDYGILNIGLYTKSHCDCDADFYRCLREVRSRTADMLGNLYFNVMKLQCMREERLKVCREMKPMALGFERCIRYEDSPMKTVFKFTTPPVAY